MILKMIVVWAFAFTASCTSLGLSKRKQENYDRLQRGMVEAQVVDLVGEPESKAQRRGIDIWSYEILSRDGNRLIPYKILFKDGAVTEFFMDIERDQANQAEAVHLKSQAPIETETEKLQQQNLKNQFLQEQQRRQ